jgi:hypothetical protein
MGMTESHWDGKTDQDEDELVMRAKGWSNGQWRPSGAGYGIRLRAVDRDRYFRRDWSYVLVELPAGERAQVRLSESFWRASPELRSCIIGRWMVANRLAPWSKARPPALTLQPIVDNTFRLLPHDT